MASLHVCKMESEGSNFYHFGVVMYYMDDLLPFQALVRVRGTPKGSQAFYTPMGSHRFWRDKIFA